MEHRMLFVTSQSEMMAPLMMVIKTVLQQNPILCPPPQALSQAGRQQVDLVIVDMQGCQEGLSLVHQFKHHHRMVPVIALVPYGDISMVERVLGDGADDYISQPISIERLKTSLRNALRLRNLLVGVSEQRANLLSYVGELPNSRLSFLRDEAGKLKKLQEIEDMVVEHAIEACDGCITRAARALGIGRSTLYRKMQSKTGDHSARENQTTRPMMLASSRSDS